MTIPGARLGALLLALALCVPPAGAHPELLAQIEEIDRLLEAEPGRADLLARRSDLHRRHGDFEAAAADLAAARALPSEDPLLDYIEGELRLDTGDAAGAEAALNRFIAAEPGRASAWVLRARARLALGRPAQAAADFGAAVDRADPASPALFRDWALALVAAGGPRWFEAAEVVERGLGNFPQDPALLALGADLALALDQPGRAASYIDRLPDGALRITAWAERDARRRCLEDADEGKTDCLEDARRQLAAQSGPAGD